MIAPLLRRSLPAAFLAAIACATISSTASAQDAAPAGFTALFNGKDLSGWFGWGTKDPRDLQTMTPEALAAYKKLSVEGDPAAKNQDHVNAHWKVESGELVNDGKGL